MQVVHYYHYSDPFGKFLTEAECKDVTIELQLIPVNSEKSANIQDVARLEIYAVWVWSTFECTF